MRSRPLLLLWGLLTGLLVVPFTSSASQPAGPASRAAAERQVRDLVVEVLSNRRDLVSGGDALVEVVLPRTVAAAGEGPAERQ